MRTRPHEHCQGGFHGSKARSEVRGRIGAHDLAGVEDGEHLVRRNRPRWDCLDSRQRLPVHTRLVTTIVLLVVFGGLSVGMREWFAQRRRHSDGPHSFKERVDELLTPVDAATPAAQETSAS